MCVCIYSQSHMTETEKVVTASEILLAFIFFSYCFGFLP